MNTIYKLSLTFIILTVFFLFSGFIVGCQSDLKKKEYFLKKANNYYDQKEYKKAEIELRNAIKIDPEYTKAYYLLAETLLESGNIKGAFSMYAKVVQLKPDNLKAQLKLAQFLFLGKKIEPALEKTSLILEKEPENITALHIKAQIFLVQKLYQKAELIYNAILKIDDKNIIGLQNLARIKVIENRYQEAEELILKAIAIDKQNIKLYSFLTQLYLKNSSEEKVEPLLLKAVKNNSHNEQAYILLGSYYLSQKQFNKAETVYLDATKIDNNVSQSYMVLAKFYENTKNIKKALDAYEKAAIAAPNNLSIKSSIARFHFNNSDMLKARLLNNKILEKRPQFFPAKLLKTEILLSDKQFDEVLPLIQSLEKDEPKSYRVYYLKGLYNIGKGQVDQAKTSILKSSELNPGFLKSKLLLANLYLKEMSYDEARIEAMKALELSSENIYALRTRAMALMGLKKYKEAEKDFLTLIKLSPDNPLFYYRTGLLKVELKEYDDAYKYFLEAYEKNSNNLDLFLQIIRILIIQKEFSKANDFCNNQLKLVEKNTSAKAFVYNTQAEIFLQQNDILKAKQLYKDAIKNNPKFLSPYRSLAKLNFSNKKNDLAIEQYQAILTIKPNDAHALMMLGMIYDSEKKYDKAAVHYQKSLTIQPDNALAANNLAYHLAVRTNELEKALELAQEVKGNFPDDPSIADTLGLIYYKKGLYKNAQAEFSDSLKKLSDNAIVNFHLGRTYTKSGNLQLAEKYLKIALKLDSRFEGHKEAQNILERLKE